jgi:hypothetical protein
MVADVVAGNAALATGVHSVRLSYSESTDNPSYQTLIGDKTMKQVNREQAIQVIDNEIESSITWAEISKPIPKAMKQAISEFAELVAMRVLDKIGCFDVANRKELDNINRRADEAKARHDRWCKQSGSRF